MHEAYSFFAFPQCMKEQCQVAVTSFTLNMGVVLYAKQIMYAFQEITKYVCISGDRKVCMHFRRLYTGVCMHAFQEYGREADLWPTSPTWPTCTPQT